MKTLNRNENILPHHEAVHHLETGHREGRMEAGGVYLLYMTRDGAHMMHVARDVVIQ